MKVPVQLKKPEMIQRLQQEMASNIGWYEEFLILFPNVTKQSVSGEAKDDMVVEAAFSEAGKLEKLNPVLDNFFAKN